MDGRECAQSSNWYEFNNRAELRTATFCFRPNSLRTAEAAGFTNHSATMDRLNHVLSHLMASNQLVLENSRTIQDLCLQHRLVENCEQDEGTGGPVMHR